MRLNYQFALIQAIRNYFTGQGFTDVMTPPMVANPGMETHIHPFEVYSKRKNESSSFYLHTSPEFHMKELLSYEEEGLDKIFNISYCFRDEPQSPIHRPQFLMLEWYRKRARYEAIMKDCEELVSFCANELAKKGATSKGLEKTTPQKATVQEVVLEECGFDILQFLDKEDLKAKIKADHKEVPVPEAQCEWDDYFFLLFLNLVEPTFKHIPYLTLYEFPAPLAALSTLKASDPRVCERFEVYLSGVELCNCFNELTDAKEQRKRFQDQAREKERIYGYELPEPAVLYDSLDRGLPACAGIALGVERLLGSLIETTNPFYR